MSCCQVMSVDLPSLQLKNLIAMGWLARVITDLSLQVPLAKDFPYLWGVTLLFLRAWPVAVGIWYDWLRISFRWESFNLKILIFAERVVAVWFYSFMVSWRPNVFRMLTRATHEPNDIPAPRWNDLNPTTTSRGSRHPVSDLWKRLWQLSEVQIHTCCFNQFSF